MQPPHRGRPGGGKPPSNRGPGRPSGGNLAGPGRPSGGNPAGPGRPSGGNPAGPGRAGGNAAGPRRPSPPAPARPEAPRFEQRLSLARPPQPARAPEKPRDPSREPKSAEPRSHEPRTGRREHAPRTPQAPDAPRGTVWLYGLHAVAAALANPQRRLRRLVLSEEAQAALLARMPPPWPLVPEVVERGRVDALLGRDAVHQGVALLADLLAPPPLATVLERPGPVLVLDQVTDPRNVGAILRSAAAFGAAAVITQERNAPEENGALAKAASGALETVPLLRAVNIARTLIALKAAGCWTVGLDAGGPPLSGAALAGRRVALVLGNEGEGLRRLTRETCDEVAGIAMPGGGASLDSLNVSASAAVALYELGRK